MHCLGSKNEEKGQEPTRECELGLGQNTVMFRERGRRKSWVGFIWREIKKADFKICYDVWWMVCFEIIRYLFKLFFQGKNKLVWLYAGPYYYPWSCHFLHFKVLSFLHTDNNHSIDWWPVREVCNKKEEIPSWMKWDWKGSSFRARKCWSRIGGFLR